MILFHFLLLPLDDFPLSSSNAEKAQINNEENLEMNNQLVKLVLIALLLMMVISPFAGLAPLMLILLGLGICWAIWSLVQAFFTADVEGNDKKAEFESSRGE